MLVACLVACLALGGLSGCGGSTSATDTAVGDPPDSQNGTQNGLDDPVVANEEDAPGSGGSFQLNIPEEWASLTEGRSGKGTLSFGISRFDGHQRAVNLRVEPAAEFTTPVFSALDHSSLVDGNLYTTWRFRLPVGPAPLLPHERQYRVHADDGREQQTRTVTLAIEPAQAPDVYLLIGQSNMEGSTEIGSREVDGLDSMHPRIQQLNVRQNNRDLFATDAHFSDEAFNVMEPRFVGAEDPLHEPRFPTQPGKGGTFIGPGLSFAKAALENTTQTIVLVPAAWSATGFCANGDEALAWNAKPSDEAAQGGTLLTERALTRLRIALRDTGGILRGILWHQGEADANTGPCSERYENSLLDLIRRLRTEAQEDPRGSSARGPDAAVPFVIGTMSRGDDERGVFSVFSANKQRVDIAHRNIPNRLAYTATALADDLVPPAFPCGQGSCIHFGAAAQRELGQRYYRALQSALQNTRR